jgi:hypothetical protein
MSLTLLGVLAVGLLPSPAVFENISSPIWLPALPQAANNRSTGKKKKPPSLDEFAWFRREVLLAADPATISQASVLITARQTTDKLLASYKLWVNDLPIADGPG